MIYLYKVDYLFTQLPIYVYKFLKILLAIRLH